jgi:L,D-transpeptidase catalytic domain
VKARVIAACLALAACTAMTVGLRATDWSELAERLADLADGPSRPALEAALDAYANASHRGAVARSGLLTIIDYTLPSTEPRLWVLDLKRARVVYRELVAHGRASGDKTAEKFSNTPGSMMTSLGLFVTDTSYVGQNGYSLRLRGLEPGINDNAYARAIVMHGAAYVSQAVADRLGRLGRSLGCPAVRPGVARTLIDTIKGGTVVYAYGR